MSKKRSKARRPAKPAAQPVQAAAVESPIVADVEQSSLEQGAEATAQAAIVDTAPAAEATVTADATAGTLPEDDALPEAAAMPAESVGDDIAQANTGDAGESDAATQASPAPQAQPAPLAAPEAVSAAPFDLQSESARFAPFDDPDAIRGVLIQVAGGRLLLPNATIAEVLSYAEPDPVGGEAPDWLLGRMRWRGWQLPLVALSQLAGVGTERAGLGTKVVVLKALGGQGKTPYFAILTQGFPRLVTVSERALVREDDETLPRGIQARVRLNQDEALLPDLESIEGLIVGALAQAA